MRPLRAIARALYALAEFLLTPVIERNPLRMAGYSLADVVLSSTAIALLAASAAVIYRVATFRGALGWPDAFVFAFALLALILKRKLDLATPEQAVDLLKALISRSGEGDVGVPMMAEQEAGSHAEVEGEEG